MFFFPELEEFPAYYGGISLPPGTLFPPGIKITLKVRG